MRIGIMLRHLNPHGTEMGTRIYTENIVNGILETDCENEYLLIYKDENLLGTFPLKERKRFRNRTEDTHKAFMGSNRNSVTCPKRKTRPHF